MCNAWEKIDPIHIAQTFTSSLVSNVNFYTSGPGIDNLWRVYIGRQAIQLLVTARLANDTFSYSRLHTFTS
jgi:hypothetical protein